MIFNATKASLVDISSAQTISGSKTYTLPIKVRIGGGSIEVYPRIGQIGTASIHTFRLSDGASPSMGDHWQIGQDLFVDQGFDFLTRCFAIASAGAGILTPRLYIDPNGLVSVMDGGSFYSPSIDTALLKINNVNINQTYQSKADMSTYITSGSLTNYVNTTANQSIGGKKTFTGGINTKSQTVAGATVLTNDILFGKCRK